MSYVITTQSALPSPQWATASSTAAPAAGTVLPPASAESVPAVTSSTHVTSSADSFGGASAPVPSVVTPVSGDAVPVAKMLAVTSVFSSDSSDGNGSLDHVASSDLPFTHAAPGDASDAVAPGDSTVADLGLSDGWYFA